MGRGATGNAAFQPDASQLAEDYLFNTSNRGIFERAGDFARRTGREHPTREDLTAYVLGGAYQRAARLELEKLAAAYRAHNDGPIERILDAGCGPGVTSLALADLFHGAEVIGLDVEEPALALARYLARDQPCCSFENASLEDFSAPHDGFDLVQCRSVIEHVYDPRKALQNILRLLRPGGIAFIETPNYRFPWEPHVRMPMLPKSPKPILAAQCRAVGRDPAFIDHLNFECDPFTLSRWVKAADPQLVVVDIMAMKIQAVLSEGTEMPRVAWRAKAATALRRSPSLARVAEWTLTRLGLSPSVMLMVARPRVQPRGPRTSRR